MTISKVKLLTRTYSDEAGYSQTCVKGPITTGHILAFQTGGCLLLHESSAESSCPFWSCDPDAATKLLSPPTQGPLWLHIKFGFDWPSGFGEDF